MLFLILQSVEVRGEDTCFLNVNTQSLKGFEASVVRVSLKRVKKCCVCLTCSLDNYFLAMLDLKTKPDMFQLCRNQAVKQTSWNKWPLYSL